VSNAAANVKTVASDAQGTLNNATLGFHQVVVDEEGGLLPWMNPVELLNLEMEWYQNCPLGEHDFPVFMISTFMDGNYTATGSSSRFILFTLSNSA